MLIYLTLIAYFLITNGIHHIWLENQLQIELEMDKNYVEKYEQYVGKLDK